MSGSFLPSHACPFLSSEQRASLEARQQDIRDKQLAVQQSTEYVEKLKVGAWGGGWYKGCWVGE